MLFNSSEIAETMQKKAILCYLYSIAFFVSSDIKSVGWIDSIDYLSINSSELKSVQKKIY